MYQKMKWTKNVLLAFPVRYWFTEAQRQKDSSCVTSFMSLHIPSNLDLVQNSECSIYRRSKFCLRRAYT